MSIDSTTTKNLIPIKNLPIYENKKKLLKFEKYKFIEDEPLPFQKQCCEIRKKIVEEYRVFTQKFKLIDQVINSVKHNLLDDNSYLRSDKVALLPKVAAISFGGMTGFLLSLRRYGKLRKVFYPFTGSLIMSAFCYPNETIDFIQIGLAHSERTWNNFKNSPDS